MENHYRLYLLMENDDKGTHRMRTPGGEQNIHVMSEPAFYKVIMSRQSGKLKDDSKRDAIKNFQRCVSRGLLEQTLIKYLNLRIAGTL